MVRRQVIKGALRGFLGTFTSRYSDFHGYWLLGQLLANVSRWHVSPDRSKTNAGQPVLAISFTLSCFLVWILPQQVASTLCC